MRPDGATDERAIAAPRASCRFVTGCAGFALLLLVLFVWLAHGEYFYGDDLVFLRRARMPRDWFSVFVSFRPRGWWSYRPLSIEVFFSALNATAGLDPFPYLLASVLTHLVAGSLVYRIAVQLGIDRRVALVAGLLKVSMYPSLNGELFWISAFQTVLGTFFYLLTVTLFVDFLQGGRRSRRVAACIAMILALLSNELAVTLPGPLVLLAVFFSRAGRGAADVRERRQQGRGDAGAPLGDVRRSGVARLRGALRACAPLVAILGVYLPFRYWLIWESFLPTPALNVPYLGWHVVWNVPNFVRILTGRSAMLQMVLIGLLVAGWVVAAQRRDGAVALLARRTLLLWGWLLCAMVPFLGAYFLYHRAAIVLEAPFCLLLASHLDPIARAASTQRTARALELAMAGLLLAAFPYRTIVDQARMPRGQVNRDLLEILEREPLPLVPGTCVRLVPRPGDAWTSSELFALRFHTTGLFAVHHPGVHLELPPEPGAPAPPRRSCAAIVEIELLHGVAGSRPTFTLRRMDRAVSWSPLRSSARGGGGDLTSCLDAELTRRRTRDSRRT